MKKLLLITLIFVSTRSFSQAKDTTWATYETRTSRGLLLVERVRVVYTGMWSNKTIVKIIDLYHKDIQLTPSQLKTLKKTS